MNRPPYGVSFPCRLHRVIDGDTIEVVISGSWAWRIRLIDCWCPEVKGPEKEAGLQAKQFAARALEDARQLTVFVPFDMIVERQGHGPINLLDFVTFDRVPAFLYLNEEETLNALLVKHGHATSTKKGS
jgi:endonuclease YncB( thermonuclease family)